MMNNVFYKFSILALLTLITAGCTVGPDYHLPAEPYQDDKFKRLPEENFSVSPAVSQWWLALNDPLLNMLIQTALDDNPDIAIAEARLRQARASLSREQANAYPNVSASGAAVRTRLPDSAGITKNNPLDLYTSAFDASWELDLFGGTRRAVEAESAQEQASAASLSDTHVSIAAEVAKNYLTLCGDRQQLAILRHSVAVQQQMLTLTQQRRERGAVSDSDVERLITQLETTRAQISPLEADISDILDRLAALMGKTPGELDRQLSSAQTLPTLPVNISVGKPADMLRQRPDIRSAERQLAASTAQIGEHVADYFPSVNLFGTLGFSSTGGGPLMAKQNMSWTLVPYLQWHFLDFGRVKAQVKIAQAKRDEAQAKWTKTVLEALRDANTSLSRYGHQRVNLVALARVSRSAARSSTLMRQRYQAGAASMIDLLDTQRSLLSAQQEQVNAQTQLTIDYVALQKSLGLGWHV
ncbi:MAG: efflux transporter outer membrane subunit [Enterobacteriaceae bacterium]|nr:efflux transporter outer membrane subunit [Enterobacteriaceae bacterium]